MTDDLAGGFQSVDAAADFVPPGGSVVAVDGSQAMITAAGDAAALLAAGESARPRRFPAVLIDESTGWSIGRQKASWKSCGAHH